MGQIASLLLTFFHCLRNHLPCRGDSTWLSRQFLLIEQWNVEAAGSRARTSSAQDAEAPKASNHLSMTPGSAFTWDRGRDGQRVLGYPHTKLRPEPRA
jgi:hypothetical protein